MQTWDPREHKGLIVSQRNVRVCTYMHVFLFIVPCWDQIPQPHICGDI